MLDGLINDLPTYGPWGMAVAVLLAGNVAQWKRSNKQQDDYFEQSVQTTAALVELNVVLRNQRK